MKFRMPSLSLILQRIGIDLLQVILRYIDEKQMENLSHTTTEPPSLLRKMGAFVLTAALIGLVLMFSVLLLLAILTVGAMAWVYLWWRTRDLRKRMRMHPTNYVVIEGEVVREVDSSDGRER